jgi:hypothetical protein
LIRAGTRILTLMVKKRRQYGGILLSLPAS